MSDTSRSIPHSEYERRLAEGHTIETFQKAAERHSKAMLEALQLARPVLLKSLFRDPEPSEQEIEEAHQAVDRAIKAWYGDR